MFNILPSAFVISFADMESIPAVINGELVSTHVSNNYKNEAVITSIVRLTRGMSDLLRVISPHIEQRTLHLEIEVGHAWGFCGG